jgi:hypothetical protein
MGPAEQIYSTYITTRCRVAGKVLASYDVFVWGTNEPTKLWTEETLTYQIGFYLAKRFLLTDDIGG